MRYIRQMPKDPKKRRFEVHFLPDKSREFEKEAKKDGRSLKNLMEKILLDWLEKQKEKK
jgi:hypothetical protein